MSAIRAHCKPEKLTGKVLSRNFSLSPTEGLTLDKTTLTDYASSKSRPLGSRHVGALPALFPGKTVC